MNFKQKNFFVEINNACDYDLVADNEDNDVEYDLLLALEVYVKGYLNNLKVVEEFDDYECVHEEQDGNVERHPFYEYWVQWVGAG